MQVCTLISNYKFFPYNLKYRIPKGAELSYNNAFANGTATKQIILKFLYCCFTLQMHLTYIGPYAAYMVSGKQQMIQTYTSETKLNTNDFKRFDFQEE
jgi:hypothetical protein